jgi:hypothetical protein
VDNEAGASTDPAGSSTPTGQPDGERRRRWPLLVALLVVLGTAAATALILQPWAGSKYPNEWDARVVPIVEEVARLRDLEFDHPVAVDFLSGAEFDERVTVDAAILSEEDEEDLEQINGVVRALGLGAGDVDVLEGSNAANSAGVLAYYDPESERIVVSGEELDVALEVTIAHELVHVLQDQHFDLERLGDAADDSDTGDSSAWEALIEGDAEHVEEAYVEQLSDADSQAYERLTEAAGEDWERESDDVPEFLEVAIGAPYLLGPNTIALLVDEGGNAAVDAAISGPTPSSRMFIEPGNFTGSDAPDPALPHGVDRIGAIESFNAFDVYLMIAARADHYLALRAADAVAGGRIAVYADEGDGTVCVRVSVASDRGRAHLIRGLKAWAATIPGASVDARFDAIAFSSCDPDESGDAPRSLEPAVGLLALRHQLNLELSVGGELEPGFARCLARGLAHNRDVMDAIIADPDGEPTEEMSAAIRHTTVQASERCAVDKDAGLE